MSQNLPARFGKYELLELVARGGMAEIYRARTVGIGGFEKYCAIKKILPHLSENQEFITMLIDEAKIVVSLQHANIVQVLDLGRIDNSYYIAMEYVHGMDLATIIKTCAYNNFMMPYEHTVYIAMQVCSGLYHAHSKTDSAGRNLGIIHRDISPHNILISYDGQVKIIDFGVAKASIKMSHTMSGIIKGKLLYMAPEQAMAKEIDHRADLFALGLVLYKMTTFKLPFEGENEFQIYNKLVQGKVVPPKRLNPDIPDSLNEVILKALKRKPSARYQDAFQFRTALSQVLAELAPGYSASRLAQFMETYFPPRPVATPPPPTAEQVNQALEAEADMYASLLEGGEDVLSSTAYSQGGATGQLPGSQDGAPPVIEGAGPLGPGHVAGPSYQGMPPPPSHGIGQFERTVKVSTPYGVGLLSGETIPAAANLSVDELVPDGLPDVRTPVPPRYGLGFKIFIGVVVFLVLLFAGIVGGYQLLVYLSAPKADSVHVAARRPSASRGARHPRGEVADVPGEDVDIVGGAARPGRAHDGAEAMGRDGPREGERPGPGEIRITLQSIPQGAEIYQGILRIGQTDMTIFKKRKKGAKIRFRFIKEGYREVQRTVSLDRDRRVLVRLRRR